MSCHCHFAAAVVADSTEAAGVDHLSLPSTAVAVTVAADGKEEADSDASDEYWHRCLAAAENCW